MAPAPTHNTLSDFRRRHTLLGHFVGKENLLDADLSPGSVVGGVAIEKAPVLEPVTEAVAGLLRQDLGTLGGDPVGALQERVLTERSGRHEPRERFGRFRTLVEGGRASDGGRARSRRGWARRRWFR